MNDPLLVKETRWYSRPGFKAVKTLNRKVGGNGVRGRLRLNSPRIWL